jgi:hypothetical protein
MKAILLARVSSKEQEEGQSIPAQERRLREYAERKGLVVDEVFKITESSTKDTRKEFEKILERIRKSRVQRSFKESVILDILRRDGKVEIHFMREGLILNLKSNSSEVDEKRELMNLVFQNLKLEGKKMLTETREPFSTMIGYKDCPINWRWRELNSRPKQTL